MTVQTSSPDVKTESKFVLDLDDPAFIKDPYPTYQWLRDNAPVFEWQGHGGLVFSRYRDVRAIYNDRRISNDVRLWEHSQKEVWPPELDDMRRLFDSGLFRLGPADHARVRKLVSFALTPRSVERMKGEIQATVDSVLASVAKGETLNVRDYAEPIPLRVISDMLKVPERFRADFRAFGVASITASTLYANPAEMFRVLAPLSGWMKMLREMIADRAAHPLDDDLLTTLIVARDEGAKLSEDELVSLIHALITAGSDTTVHASCFAIYSFLRHPEALAEVRADPSLLRNAIEETLRYDLFGKGGLPKICTEDMEIGGKALRKGQMVFAFVPSALHDPEAFPEPERFDIRRDLSQTIAFGGGQHFCLGAALARMELDTAVGTLIRKFPAMRLLGEPEFEASPVMRSMKMLKVALV